MRTLRDILKLTKIGIPLLVTASTAMGYLTATGGSAKGILVPLLGIFLLAAGSAALNQYQDRHLDALMTRTRNRPVAAGRIGGKAAGLIAGCLILAGSTALFFSGLPAFLPALSALVLYNLFYTYLKRASSFTFLPGALIGAIPPVVGWTAAGGGITDPRAIAVALFLFLWQVPHFLIVLLRHEADYRRAGLPVITDLLSQRQIRRILIVWITATAVSALILVLYLPFHSSLLFVCLLAGAVWLGGDALRQIGRSPEQDSYRRAFVEINAFALLVFVLFSLNTLL